jgi:hypothetical protein
MTAQIISLRCEPHGMPARTCPLCHEASRPRTAGELLVSQNLECLTANLHLKSYLKRAIGPDFATRYPETMSLLEARIALGEENYRVWSAWAATRRGLKSVSPGIADGVA